MKQLRRTNRSSSSAPPLWALAVCVILTSSAVAWNPFKAVGNLANGAWNGVKGIAGEVGGFLGAPLGGFIGSATAPTINQAETAGHRLIEDMDKRMESRINQLDKVIDKSIGQIDLTLEKRIAQTDEVLKNRIAQVDTVLASRIDQIDGILGRSIADVDQLLSDRLAQLDEIAEKRIGNLDIIATKASLTFEEGFLRILAMGCLMVFLAAAIWRMYVEGTRAWSTAQSHPETSNRIKALFGLTWRKLGGQVGLTGAALVVLYCAFAFFPGGPRSRAAKLAVIHENAFTESLNVFDLQRARYHAAQLQVIDPLSSKFRGIYLKADLIRDLFSRPALLQTPSGVNQIARRVDQIEQMLGIDKDPDILAVKAYVHWRAGATKADEFQAADYSVTALLLQDQFALRSLATSIVLNYWHSPLPDGLLEDSKRAIHARIKSVVAKIRVPSMSQAWEPNPLEYVIKYNEFVRYLDRASMTSYLNLLDAQAVLRVAVTAKKEQKVIDDAKSARKGNADAITKAWEAFYAEIRDPALFEGTSAPLAAFLLNDAVQMRAFSYQAELDGNGDLPPPVLNIPVERRQEFSGKLLRVKLEKDYPHLLPRVSRDIVDFEEAKRFFDNEKRLYEFEQAYLEFQRALAGTTPIQIVKSGLDAAEKAANANIYDYRVEIPQSFSISIYQKMEATLQANFLKTGEAKDLVNKSLEPINTAIIARRAAFL